MPARPPPLDDETLHALIPRLRRFARSLASDAAAADDLVQACLERALQINRKNTRAREALTRLEPAQPARRTA